jgi:hypothetical protein
MTGCVIPQWTCHLIGTAAKAVDMAVHIQSCLLDIKLTPYE